MKRITLTALTLIGLGLPALAQITVSSPGGTPLSPVTVTYSQYYKVEPGVVNGLVAQKVSNDDISVALFLANIAKVTPETVIGYRAKGLSWADITGQLGVKPDVYFVGLPANPGPPYGNAWDYWKLRKAQPATVFNLGDDDIRNLVQLRLVSQYYKVKPKTVIQWRGSGKDFSAIIADQYGKKMGQGNSKNFVTMTIPAGTNLGIALVSAVSSKNASVGDAIQATTTEALIQDGVELAPAGSAVAGTVTDVISASRNGSVVAQLNLVFNSLATVGGSKSIHGLLLGGEKKAGSSTVKDAAIIVGSGAGGAILGKIIGKTGKATAIGGAIGAAAGIGVAAMQKGNEVTLPAGTKLTIVLDNPVQVAVKR